MTRARRSCHLFAMIAAAAMAHAAEPDFVVIAGDLQSELGCTQDWHPGCTVTALQFDADDSLWQGSWTVPAGSYLYGAALHLDWSEPYGLHAHPMTPGYEIPLSLANPRTVKFYYDPASHWIVDNLNTRIVTAPGDYQREIGCSGDWQPGCLRGLLEDVNDDGVFERRLVGLPAGSYEFRIAIDESWTENYGLDGQPGGANLAFDVASASDVIDVRFVSATNRAAVAVFGDPVFRNDFE